MKPMRTLVLTLALGLACGAALYADDTPTTKPSKSGKGPRVIKPYSNLTDLTSEQKSKIAAIHKEVLAQEKKLEEKERADCMDVLTPEQRDELEKSSDADTTTKKKGKSEAATEPAM